MIESSIMNPEELQEIQNYKELAPLNEKHGVFLVRNEQTGHICVKKIQKTFNMDVYNRIRASRIKGIPEIYHMYESGDSLTIIEEYVSGGTIDSILKTKGAMPADMVRDIAIKLCDVLKELHDLRPPVIHRDIKPSNVVVTSSGEVYLLDLNVAKIESAGKEEDTVLLGTYGYAAPEQYGFGSSTVQTDIYALGMLMNTMLKGEYSRDIAEGSILSAVISRCVMLNPEDRYRSVKELRLALSHPKSRNVSSWLPPGFRSGNILHMLTAAVGYSLIAALCLTLETKNQGYMLITWYERVFCLAIMLMEVFFLADYRGIHQRLPLCRSNNPAIKIIGIIIFAFIFFIGVIFIMLAGEMIILSILNS